MYNESMDLSKEMWIYQHLFLSLGDITNDNEEYWAASRGNRQETVDLAIKDFH